VVRAVRAKAEVTGRAKRALTGKVAALGAGLSWLVAERSACPGGSVVAGTGTRRAPSPQRGGTQDHELAHQAVLTDSGWAHAVGVLNRFAFAGAAFVRAAGRPDDQRGCRPGGMHVDQQAAMAASKPSAIVTGLNVGLKAPLLWAPIAGIAVVLADIHLPAVIVGSFDLIGSATSGVAVFAVGLVLAAHPVRLSPGVCLGSLARVTVQSARSVGSLTCVARRESVHARSARVLQFSFGHRGRALCRAIQGC
jgi:hypothetical protein